MSLERRLAALEASLPTRNVDNGARERLEAKLAAISEAHRVRRQRGEDPVLEGQSMASLLALIHSYPSGAVPPEVTQAAWAKAQAMRPGLRPVVSKLVRNSLASKGYRSRGGGGLG